MQESSIIPRGQILSYIQGLMSSMLVGQYTQFVQNKKVLSQTALIDRKGVNAVNFSLTEEEKQKLVISGCETVANYYSISTSMCSKLIQDQPYKTQLTGISGFYNNSIEKAQELIKSPEYQERLKQEQESFAKMKSEKI